jgi:hypothetical protein
MRSQTAAGVMAADGYSHITDVVPLKGAGHPAEARTLENHAG